MIQWKCHQMYGWVVRSGELKQPKTKKRTQNNKVQRTTTNRENSGMLYVNISWNLSTWFWHVCTRSPRPKTVCCRYVFSDDSGDFPKDICVWKICKKQEEEVFLIWLYCDRYIHQLGTQHTHTHMKIKPIMFSSQVMLKQFIEL